MNSDELHRLLSRQLKKLGLRTGVPPNPVQWETFLQRVSRTYSDSDSDRYLMERSLTVSSEEMQALYQQLQEASETQIAEERDKLGAVITSVGDGLCALDVQGRLLFINPAGEELLGWSSDQLVGRDFITLVAECLFDPDQPFPSGREIVREARATDRPLRGEAGRFQNRDGELIPVAFVLNPVRTSDPTLGAVLVFRDITSRLRVQRALEEAKEAAEQANVAKSAFLANMSHELRTPLNAVIGYSELLLEEYEDSPNATLISDLQRIRTAGSHLLELISDVLDLAKIEAGKSELHLTRFDLAEFVNGLAGTVQPAVEENHNRLLLRLPPEPGMMTADPTKLRQTLLNLMSNAAKFTRDGEITVTVKRQVTAGQERVTFLVKDTGIGIAPDRLPSLFEPFVQADGHVTLNYGGTGLGLAISRHLCEMMGGSIRAESKPGEGSLFRVDLPADVATALGTPLNGDRPRWPLAAS